MVVVFSVFTVNLQGSFIFYYFVQTTHWSKSVLCRLGAGRKYRVIVVIVEMPPNEGF